MPDKNIVCNRLRGIPRGTSWHTHWQKMDAHACSHIEGQAVVCLVDMYAIKRTQRDFLQWKKTWNCRLRMTQATSSPLHGVLQKL